MKIAVAGWGRLGKAIADTVSLYPDIELKYIFSRREGIEKTYRGAKILPFMNIEDYREKVDCLIISQGSAVDLPKNAPRLASVFNTVDGYDMHSAIPGYHTKMDEAARFGNKLSLIASGWDPGFFSVIRIYLSAFMPDAESATFWGEGISQGHSEAIRRINGVIDAVQYTIPDEDERERALRGEKTSPKLSHKRICYVAAEQGNEPRIEAEIRNMDGYFKGYRTEIYFTDPEDVRSRTASLFHGGEVIAARAHEDGITEVDLSLRLASNPHFTARILLASARAVYRMHTEGRTGAVTLADIPPKMLISESIYKYI